jgi:hypothetical protein
MGERTDMTGIGSELQARAWIRIFGTGLDFDAISGGVGLQPSDVHHAGDPAPSGTPLPRDLWSLASPLPRSEPLDSHIKWLARSLQPAYAFLRSLKEKAEVRSFCGMLIQGDSATFRVSAEALKPFVELAIDLEVSLIFTGYSDERAAAPEAPTSGSDSEAYRTESRVLLDLRGDGLDPAGIFRALGGEPAELHRAGELDASGHPFSTNTLSLTVPLDREEELDSHLKWLAGLLARHRDALRGLEGNVEGLVRCEFRTESDNAGFGVSPGALGILVELDLALEVVAHLM